MVCTPEGLRAGWEAQAEPVDLAASLCWLGAADGLNDLQKLTVRRLVGQLRVEQDRTHGSTQGARGWRVDTVLEHGAFGTVLSARNSLGERRVVEVLQPGRAPQHDDTCTFSATTVERVLAEREYALTAHKNLREVFHWGFSADRAFFYQMVEHLGECHAQDGGGRHPGSTCDPALGSSHRDCARFLVLRCF